MLNKKIKWLYGEYSDEYQEPKEPEKAEEPLKTEPGKTDEKIFFLDLFGKMADESNICSEVVKKLLKEEKVSAFRIMSTVVSTVCEKKNIDITDMTDKIKGDYAMGKYTDMEDQ